MATVADDKEKQCLFCNKVLSRESKKNHYLRDIYCSQFCYAEHVRYKTNQKRKICKKCGNSFGKEQRGNYFFTTKFCSNECGYNAKDKIPALEKIMKKISITTNNCWIWTGKKDKDGYGCASIKRRTSRVHRIVYEETREPIPPRKHIDHLCKNRACCNPDHLEVVTPAENARRGSRVKLNKNGVRIIRRTFRMFKTRPSKMAKYFNVSTECIYDVLNNKTWKEL